MNELKNRKRKIEREKSKCGAEESKELLEDNEDETLQDFLKNYEIDEKIHVVNFRQLRVENV